MKPKSDKQTRFAYLVPEFPGQTHIFFWREMKALQQLGISVEWVSTRRPQRSIVSHSWSEEAIRNTTYLFPPSASMVAAGAMHLLLAGPYSWTRCFKAIWGIRDVRGVGKFKLLALLLPAAQLVRMAKKRGWKHLHVHSCADSAFLAFFAHLLSGLPYSLTLHSPLAMYGPAQREKWQMAAFGIAVTQKLRNEVLAEIPDLPPQHVSTAAMGVDLSVFCRTLPYTAARQGETCRIVTCGRLHPAKGHYDVIKAIALLRDKGYAISLTVLGEGPARPMLEETIHSLKLADHVRLAGAVSETVVRDELQKAHIFSLGSHDEAIGVATMEAMAMELPVVVTDVGGVRELVREEVDGLFVPARNPEALASALEYLMQHPEQAIAMGKSGCDRVRKFFGSDASARLIAREIQSTKVRSRASVQACNL